MDEQQLAAAVQQHPLFVAQQQQLLAAQEENQLLHEQVGDLQGQVEELQEQVDDQQGVESDVEEEEDEEDPLVMGASLDTACRDGDIESITAMLDAGKSVNCVGLLGWTPVLIALCFGQLLTAEMLVGRGADLSRVSHYGSNALHCAAQGGVDCINFVLARAAIDVNSSTDYGTTPLHLAVVNNSFEAATLLVEKGANLFAKNQNGNAPMDSNRGPQLLQHAKDLVWDSVKPLLLLSNACSSEVVLPSDPSIAIPTSLLSVLGNPDIVRHLSTFVKRTDIITRDPDTADDEPEPDEVRIRVEAELASGGSSSSSSSSNNKRARTE